MLALQNRSEMVIPKLNDYWPGQGGIFRGTHLLGGYMIEAAKLLPKTHKFELYGQELKDFSDLDGAENTRKLVELGSPAAKAAAKYTADGHSDFYLPAQRELMQVGAVRGFDEDGLVTCSSTPYGSNYAWALDFEDGYVNTWSRLTELAVLPVRRFIPSSL